MRKFILICVFITIIGINSHAQAVVDSKTVTVTANVLEQTSSLTLTQGTVNFGDLDPENDLANRFLASAGNCAWIAPTGTNVTWRIEVTTSNTHHFPGIVDATENHYLPLKFNHQGLGANDPTDNNNWTGETATFLWVFDPFDDGVNGPGSDGFASKFTQRGDQPDIGNLDYFFAVEVANNAFPTSYGGIVTFDLIVDALP